jgi:hypothetical protein
MIDVDLHILRTRAKRVYEQVSVLLRLFGRHPHVAQGLRKGVIAGELPQSLITEQVGPRITDMRNNGVAAQRKRRAGLDPDGAYIVPTVRATVREPIE